MLSEEVIHVVATYSNFGFWANAPTGVWLRRVVIRPEPDDIVSRVAVVTPKDGNSFYLDLAWRSLLEWGALGLDDGARGFTNLFNPTASPRIVTNDEGDFVVMGEEVLTGGGNPNVAVVDFRSLIDPRRPNHALGVDGRMMQYGDVQLRFCIDKAPPDARIHLWWDCLRPDPTYDAAAR